MRRPRADDHRTQTREIGRTAPSHFLFFVIVRRDRHSFSFLLVVDSPHNRLLEKIPSAWEERPPHSTKRKLKKILHERVPPCPRKGASNFADKNRLVLGFFLSPGTGPPLFTITTVLLDTPIRLTHELHQVGRLTIQHITNLF